MIRVSQAVLIALILVLSVTAASVVVKAVDANRVTTVLVPVQPAGR